MDLKTLSGNQVLNSDSKENLYMLKASSILKFVLLIVFLTINIENLMAQSGKDAVAVVKKTSDFAITGDGAADNWLKTEWIELNQLTNHEKRDGLLTKAKVLYSDTGIYFLFHCEDEILTATMDSHFMELWREDVVEVFLWPDESEVTYFEYELSPLNYELPILVGNVEGKQSHWIPFDYSYKDERKTLHKTSVKGGEKQSGAHITEWTAEFFIPFELLRPLNNIFPESGTSWRANLYRIDYDKGTTHWAWQPIQTNFHDYERFGTFLFE